VPSPSYIRALLTAIMIRRDIPDDLEAAVQARIDKQDVVHRGDHRFAVVLEESVAGGRLSSTTPIRSTSNSSPGTSPSPSHERSPCTKTSSLSSPLKPSTERQPASWSPPQSLLLNTNDLLADLD